MSGSLYAGKLSQAGYDVTLLVRGKRLEELKERGLALVESAYDLQYPKDEQFSALAG